jgi:hypothetical protein
MNIFCFNLSNLAEEEHQSIIIVIIALFHFFSDLIKMDGNERELHKSPEPNS